jgi:CMP-N-acetylneuraminic acid synthetase
MFDAVGKIIIPARMGSKGMPHKNRFLLNTTLDIIPNELLHKTIVTTNDKEIENVTKNYSQEIDIHNRSDKSASDIAPMTWCVDEVLNDYSIDETKDIILLYLTYPERTWDDVIKIYEFYNVNGCSSLLCGFAPSSHPYLCMSESEDNKGKLLISHDLYRRQDYPKCFCVSHFVVMFKGIEFSKLNYQLFNVDTTFYKLQNKAIDVDYEEDYLNAKNKNNC